MANNENSNIKQEYNNATTGLNLDQTLNQIKKGSLTYALNANVENFDANSVNYQNEQGNELCVSFPDGFILMISHYIQEKRKHIFFTTNPITGESQIGYMDNNDCQYRILVDDACLGWDINFPIHKIVHRITNCTTEIFWTDNIARRHLDIDNVPYKLKSGSELCDPEYTNEIDCNQLKVQPDFNIPSLNIMDVTTGGNLISGTYQFTAQYSDSLGNPYTAYYSITNPTPIADVNITSVNFNYPVGKSIVIDISNLDITGQFQYFNLAVIKTINEISSVELIGTYFIDNDNKQITYTGQQVDNIRLSIDDIFEKFPYYELADYITTVQDVLVWKGLTSIDRVNYQNIANEISLKWQTYRIPATEDYADEINATNLRGYLRDEVYTFEIAFELRNGKITDGFHIPGREINSYELTQPTIDTSNNDYIGDGTPQPYWKIYNTAYELGTSPEYLSDASYKGPYKYGEFAYWESAETYPCNEEVWGKLAGKPIRHHKFPDVLISSITDQRTFSTLANMEMGDNAVFPIGVKIDISQITQLVLSSNLTDGQKADIVGFKILRGDRGTNKSIIGKGILRNVGKYEREDQEYYYPNYPYNDLGDDPFLNETNNAFSEESNPWLITGEVVDPTLGFVRISYISPNNGKEDFINVSVGETIEICSLSRPTTYLGVALIGPGNYDVWYANSNDGTSGYRVRWTDPFTNDNTVAEDKNIWLDNTKCIFGPLGDTDSVWGRVIEEGTMSEECDNGFLTPCPCESYLELKEATEQDIGIIDLAGGTLQNPRIGRRSKLKCNEDSPLTSVEENSDGYRQIFNSPETSFGQPFLGNVLKLENVMYGKGKAHFVEVKDNAKYKLISKEAQKDALNSSEAIGQVTSEFNAIAMFAAYQAYLTIYINGITRKNYAYSFNSIADYNYNSSIDNNGNKQREIDIARYLIPTVQSVGDDITINNYQRETSVFIKTNEELPFPNSVAPIEDNSRITIGETEACAKPGREQDISVVSYYASLKNIFVNQWGQIYSYETIDTGFYSPLIATSNITATIFGGDTFISRFAFKTKLPFFIDNRVGAPDDSDIFYDEIGNIAYPKYWHSARSVLEDKTIDGKTVTNIISYKAHNFDCPNDPALIPAGSYRTFYDGIFYLFAYGIPYFYCESSYNTDLRQAFNNREGDFWPHVSTGIPDDWVQESFVSIANDNTYYYNTTFSKQNKENTFTHLPADWEEACFTSYPFRAIYSDKQITDSDNRVNSWLIYRALSYFDFPQNYGNLTALDGIQNRGILARFENKSLLYNNLLTIDTSNPQAAYVGNPNMFAVPPIDFADTDLGWAGSQHKFLLKIPEGQITIDAKRGQVFLISSSESKVQAVDISGFGSGMNRWLIDNLPFNIIKYFPDHTEIINGEKVLIKGVNIDNHHNGIGLHGVYDSKFDRILITKLDYAPIGNVKYDEDTKEFYIEKIINTLVLKTRVYLSDRNYFCNKSWTLSFNFNTKSWISFHSYLPNFYIGENNFFYSGINTCCTDGFDAIVGELITYTSTTTTTSQTTPIPFPTTTTTTSFIDCLLLGGTFVETDCVLEGTAVVTEFPIPPACQRPEGLSQHVFYTAYVVSAVVYDTTTSLATACEGIDAYTNVAVDTFLYMTVDTASVSVGQTVYYDAVSTDCTLAPDGWYYTQQSIYDGEAIHIEGGIITEIVSCSSTTTTTTTTIAPPTTTTTTTL